MNQPPNHQTTKSPNIFHLIDRTHPAAIITLESLVRRCPDLQHRVLAPPWRCPDDEDARFIAWSPGCAARAAVLWRRPLLWVALDPPGRWAAAVLRRANAMALCFNDEMASELRRSGMPARRVEPVFDDSLPAEREPDRWDRQPGDRVIVLLADDPKQTDALAGVLAVSVAEEAANDRPDAPRLRLLAHPDALNQSRSRAMADDAGRPHRLLVDPAMDRPWKLLRSCDAALLWGERTTLAAQWCAAAGLPAIHANEKNALHAAALLNAPPPPAPNPVTDVTKWREVMTERLTRQAVRN